MIGNVFSNACKIIDDDRCKVCKGLLRVYTAKILETINYAR